MESIGPGCAALTAGDATDILTIERESDLRFLGSSAMESLAQIYQKYEVQLTAAANSMDQSIDSMPLDYEE